MYSALRPTPLRVAGCVVGALTAALAFRETQKELPPQIKQSSVLSELDKASQETSGKIWFGEEQEESSSTTN